MRGTGYKREAGRYSRSFSVGVAFILVLGTILIIFPSNMPKATASYVHHTISNLDARGLTDWGSFGRPIEYQHIPQVTGFLGPNGYNAITGLIFDQSAYDHLAVDGIADFYDSGYGVVKGLAPDFDVTPSDTSIFMSVDDGSMQKSYASFTQVDSSGGIGVSNDVRIRQTAWTILGADWILVEWRIQNIWGAPITGVNVGFGADISNALMFLGGVGADGHDDIDYWDSASSTYYVRDNFGTGPVLGFSSADPSNPFNHYYADPTVDLSTDNILYQQMTGPSKIVGMAGATRIASILSWNGYSIQPWKNRTFALVISYGWDDVSMHQAIKDAQKFYQNEKRGVQVTEIQDSSSPTQRIEVYNGGDDPVNLAPWEVRNGQGTLLTGTWIPDTNLPTGEYRYLDISGDTLAPEGDIINLYNETGVFITNAGYGQFGTIPDPITGESSARIWDYFWGKYVNNWTMTIPGHTSPSFGVKNVLPPVEPDPLVVLNEVLFYNGVWEKFIEIRYTGDTTLDITNYRIIVDSIFQFTGVTMNASVPVHYITESTPGAAALFAELNSNGDNVYLYDNNARFLDMVGWTSYHGIDESVRRAPEGEGTHDGYDDWTTEMAGWRFGVTPGFPTILLEVDQTKGADVNSIASFDLTLTNLKNDMDLIDFVVIESYFGNWTVTLYKGDGSWIPLIDTDFDGFIDIGLMKPMGLNLYESVDITVNVSVPLNPFEEKEYTLIGAKSGTSQFSYDAAFLTTEVTPYIQTSKYAFPDTIYVPGSGSPDSSRVFVDLFGAGIPQVIGRPQDTVFAIDVSGSMTASDPDGYRIIGVKDYIDKMHDEDRAAIVGFGRDHDTGNYSGAWLTQDMQKHPLKFPREAHHLKNTDSFNKTFIKDDADSLNWAEGNTNIEDALQVALQELHPSYVPGPLCVMNDRLFPPDLLGPGDGIRYGTPGHIWVIILLTDGLPSHAPTCTDDEVDFAAQNNITIYTIGLGFGANQMYLNLSIAQPTGGEYIRAETAADIPKAYERIRTLINSLAGEPIKAPVYQPMVVDIVPGEFIVDPMSIIPDPAYIGPDGLGNTEIQWDVEALKVGEWWSGSYDVSCKNPVTDQNVTLYPFALVNYLSWNGKEVHTPIPSDYITCFAMQQPIITNVSVGPGGIIIEWIDIPGADFYELYGGSTQTSLNLDLLDVIATIPAPQTWWLDTVRLTTNPDEYYYVVRAVDADSIPELRSGTSNTGGYYRVNFTSSMETFSLPLEPFMTMSLDAYMNDMGATSISWLEMNDDWSTYPPVPAPMAETGKGYVIERPGVNGSYMFTGQPASMILYKEGFGFDDATRNNLTATVDATGSVLLDWTPIAGAEKYYVYRTDQRDMFFTFGFSIFEVFAPPYQDFGAASSAGELFYIIVPYNSIDGNGSSTYSIGVITHEYNGNEMFALPLKPTWGPKSADWYTDQFTYCLGIVFLKNGYWVAHFKEFEEGVYDTIIEYGRGYELTVYDSSFYSYIGW